jgi:hypothetical protein
MSIAMSLGTTGAGAGGGAQLRQPPVGVVCLPRGPFGASTATKPGNP